LRAALPQRLIVARNEGFNDYLHTAQQAEIYATRERKRYRETHHTL